MPEASKQASENLGSVSIRGTGYRDEALCHRRDRDSGKATEKEIFTNAMESSPFFFEMTSEIGKTQSVTGGVVTSGQQKDHHSYPRAKQSKELGNRGTQTLSCYLSSGAPQRLAQGWRSRKLGHVFTTPGAPGFSFTAEPIQSK